MRSDVDEHPQKDLLRTDVRVVLHPTATFSELIAGTDMDGVDLSEYVSRCTHTSTEAKVRFSWNHGFVNQQPRPGHTVRLHANSDVLFSGVIDSVSSYTEERGTRAMEISVRRRDQIGIWRRDRLTSRTFATGSDVGQIVAEICTDLGLADNEFDFPLSGHTQPHTTLQLADTTPWQMFTDLLMAGGYGPTVDARGVFKRYSRDLVRAPDVTLDKSRVKRIEGSKTTLSITGVRLKWLDRKLKEVVHQMQPLTETTLTMGYFDSRVIEDVYFSPDRTQRAYDTHMKIKENMNDGLLPDVASQGYGQVNVFKGQIVITSIQWVWNLFVAILPSLVEKAKLGRIPYALLDIFIMGIMMRIGTGVYTIWGRPFDVVRARNTTEAIASGTPEHNLSFREIDNDLVWDEAHARDFTVRELLYESASVNNWGAEIVDDPRIEVGDIVGLPDRSRLYVTDYRRDLTRGASATLFLEGFRA